MFQNRLEAPLARESTHVHPRPTVVPNVLLFHSFHLRLLAVLVLWGFGHEGTSIAHEKEELLCHSENRGQRNRGKGQKWYLKLKLSLWHHTSQLSP